LTEPRGEGGDGRVAISVWLAAIGCVLLIGAVSLGTLGSTGLMDPDEPRYAGPARTMLRTGEFGIPMFNGEPRIVKPVLPYWLIVASSAAFGSGELGARLPSWIAGCVLAWATWIVASRRLGRRGAWIAVAFLVGTPMVIVFTRLSTPDASLAAAIAVALALVDPDRGCRTTGTGPRSALLPIAFWLVLGIAFSIKGPVALLVPGSILVVDAVWRRSPASLRALASWRGVLVFASVALPWYAYVLTRPDLGASGVFTRETLGRYFGSSGEHSRHTLYYVPLLLGGFFPASLVACGGPRGGSYGLRYPTLWVVVPLVFFSLSPSKQPAYLLPVAPGVAILAAAALVGSCGASPRGTGEPPTVAVPATVAVRATRRQGGRRLAVATAVEWIVWAAAGVGAWTYLRTRHPEAADLAVPACLLSVAAGVAVALGAALRRANLAHLARFVGVAGLAGYGLLQVAPAVEDERSFVAVASVRSSFRPGDVVAQSWIEDPGFIYYSGRRTIRLDSARNIRDNLAGPRRFHCWLQTEDLERHLPSLDRRFVVLEVGRDRRLLSNAPELVGGRETDE